jgi:hypothetical protein
VRCVELGDRQRKGKVLHEREAEGFGGKWQGGKACKVEMRRGSGSSEEDDEREIVSEEQMKNDYMGAVVFGVQGVKIAWQQ